MLKYVSCLAFVLFMASPACAQEVSFSQGMNGFGENVLVQLVEKAGPRDNVLVSPYSMSSALSLAALGARGTTREEMEKVLELPDGWNAAHQNLAKALKADEGVTLSMANGIWGAQDTKFRRMFRRQAERSFGAKIESVDFADPETLPMINGWVSKETRGMIPDLIDQLDPDLVAVLVNALYFKGDWKDAFDVKGTSDEDFHFADGGVQKISMMHRRDDFAYAAEEGWQAVALPYIGDAFELVVVLPAEGKLPLESLGAALKTGFDKRKGYLGLPKLDLSSGVELAKVLEDMGMKQAFLPVADFSAMCDRAAFISRVIHKVAMKMDEKGTEAAAATAVMMMKTAFMVEDPPFRMVVDRPYGIALRHRTSGAILFMGVVANPA
ncbi:MAG: hypothetical protein A2018_07435 [Alphaproteobacteria bacterium GWF2_58_20]|nr:MAG: hypothetical protein A2018_07435 [Alphaproteobacteria bacterium GWF2_58_20]